GEGTWLREDAATSSVVEIRLDHPDDLRGRNSDDVTHHDVTEWYFGIHPNRRQFVPARTIHPRQLTIHQEPLARIFRMHHHHRSAVGVAAARRDERVHPERFVAQIIRHGALPPRRTRGPISSSNAAGRA